MKAMFVFLLLPFLTQAQEPARGDNLILVKSVSFPAASSAFLDAGFTFKSKDTVDQIFLTEFRPISPSVSYNIRARVKDSILYLSAHFKEAITLRFGNTSTDPNQEYEASWRGMKGGDFKRVFIRMQEIASKFGGEVSYAKQ